MAIEELHKVFNSTDASAEPWAPVFAPRGLEVAIEAVDDSYRISVTTDGYTRGVTVPNTTQIRVTTADELAGIPEVDITESKSALLLVLEGAKNDIDIVDLSQPVIPGIPTFEFLVPKEQKEKVITPELVASVETHVRAQLVEKAGFQLVTLPDGISFPNEGREIDGGFLVAVDAKNELGWFYPKAVKLKKKSLKQYVTEQGNGAAYESAREAVQHAGILVAHEVEPEVDPIEMAIQSENEVVSAFMQKQLKDRLESHHKENPEWTVNYLKQLKQRILVEIGLTRMGNPALDQIAQKLLEQTRLDAAYLDPIALREYLQTRLQSDKKYFSQMLHADIPVQKEAVAWEMARDGAIAFIISEVEPNASAEEIVAAHQKSIDAPKRNLVEIPTPNTQIIVVDQNGDRLPVDTFFKTRGKSPFSIQELCSLPIRPIVLPVGKPEAGSLGLATFLFDKILHAPQVCETSGALVRMSDAKRADYIARLERTIAAGKPIIATEYVPLIAVGNPTKRTTQSPALAEIDMMRRRIEIIKAVELFYAPGMKWMYGNETPAFQGPQFLLPAEYVSSFHEQIEEMLKWMDPEGKRIQFFDQSLLYWGTPERQKEWEAYRDARTAAIKAAYENPNHPDHDEIVDYINTFIGPMATCVNPWKMFEEAKGLSLEDVLQVYAKLRELTGTNFTGADAEVGLYGGDETMSSEQTALLERMFNWGKETTFIYRTAMDAREELSSFRAFIPPDAIAHTIISKPDKLVLFPNSGQGAYFPAHGEPILQPATKPGERTTVTVHPWWMIASQPERYVPYYVDEREEPLYFMRVY